MTFRGMQRVCLSMKCPYCREDVPLDTTKSFDTPQAQEAYVEIEVDRHLVTCPEAPILA